MAKIRKKHIPVITPEKAPYVAYPNTSAIIVDNQEERVNHPKHYTWLKKLCGIEVIDITRHLNFNMGNCIKYLLRSGHKSEQGMSIKQKKIEDLKKAMFYIKDEINRLENNKENGISEN